MSNTSTNTNASKGKAYEVMQKIESFIRTNPFQVETDEITCCRFVAMECTVDSNDYSVIGYNESMEETLNTYDIYRVVTFKDKSTLSFTALASGRYMFSPKGPYTMPKTIAEEMAGDIDSNIGIINAVTTIATSYKHYEIAHFFCKKLTECYSTYTFSDKSKLSLLQDKTTLIYHLADDVVDDKYIVEREAFAVECDALIDGIEDKYKFSGDPCAKVLGVITPEPNKWADLYKSHVTGKIDIQEVHEAVERLFTNDEAEPKNKPQAEKHDYSSHDYKCGEAYGMQKAIVKVRVMATAENCNTKGDLLKAICTYEKELASTFQDLIEGEDKPQTEKNGFKCWADIVQDGYVTGTHIDRKKMAEDFNRIWGIALSDDQYVHTNVKTEHVNAGKTEATMLIASMSKVTRSARVTGTILDNNGYTKRLCISGYDYYFYNDGSAICFDCDGGPDNYLQAFNKREANSIMKTIESFADAKRETNQALKLADKFKGIFKRLSTGKLNRKTS